MKQDKKTMKKNWVIEPDANGSASGTVHHLKDPDFSARWDTGPDVLADITGPCWSDEGSGEQDQIHIFGFDWKENPPDQKHFEALMNEAVQTIDEWIAAQL